MSPHDPWAEFGWWVQATAIPCLSAVMLAHLVRLLRRRWREL